MTTLALCVALLMAAVLLWAGLAKFTELGGFAATLQALGVPLQWSPYAAALVPLSEVIAALGVLFAPHWLVTQLAVAALGGAFALAGLAALVRKRRIRCHCLGSGGYLGLTQVLALPAWIGGASILYFGFPSPVPPETGAALFAACGLAVATLKAALMRPVVRAARGDRLSAQEMYLWLPQR
jgi:hypothetical protein